MLEHPLTRGLDLDSPETTILRRRIINNKRFLRSIYREWYSSVIAEIPSGEGAVLEIGSGAGFLGELIPDLIASDTIYIPGLSVVLDGHALPFKTGSLRAIVLVNVLHHLGDPAKFISEAARCVRQGGALVMIEPWVSPWSRLIYKHVHHEPFDDGAQNWIFQTNGHLSSANSAFPWIIFARDAKRFGSEFPEFQIKNIVPFMPLAYLLSGGLSFRSFMPAASYGLWRWIENLMKPDMWAMFAKIVIVRTDISGGNKT
jgi:SAM-dependent methyltransferase